MPTLLSVYVCFIHPKTFNFLQSILYLNFEEILTWSASARTPYGPLSIKCNQVLSNEHILWCPYLNVINDYKYSHILNGDLNEKLEALKEIKENIRKRKEDSTPCDPVIC